MLKAVAVLGATGSIGCSTLDVVAAHPDRFRVVALAAGSQADRMAELTRRFRPEAVALADKAAAGRCRELLAGSGVAVLSGSGGVAEVATWPGADAVVSAIAGSAGLVPTLRAVQAGRRVALANKEALVAAGHLVLAAARASGAELLPVDSEHAALFQTLGGSRTGTSSVRRLILTASGGPFRGRRPDEMADVTPSEALHHPTWLMGPRITVDSATLMNKGLEVIEAAWLFGLPVDRIDVLIHPQSIVHAMVEFVDGSVLAQASVPDMRLFIQYALSHPERWPAPVAPLDLAAAAPLCFELPDADAFPCLDLARGAARTGGTAPAVLNAADEVAVGRFLAGDIGFGDVARLVGAVLEQHRPVYDPDIEAVLAADGWARQQAAVWRPPVRSDPQGRR